MKSQDILPDSIIYIHSDSRKEFLRFTFYISQNKENEQKILHIHFSIKFKWKFYSWQHVDAINNNKTGHLLFVYPHFL